jgi:hypothetical protein
MRIIGTAGSMDYLQDKTADRRFWLVTLEEPPTPLADADRQHLQDLSRRFNDGVCDGLHDDGAPEQYLCSRCFPDGLATDDADDEEEIR